jgi:hypothetical protein
MPETCSPSADVRWVSPVSADSLEAAEASSRRCSVLMKIPSEDDPLAVPPSQALFDDVIDPGLLRFTDVRAEAAAAECGLFGEKRRSIQVAPSAETCASTVRCDREASDKRLRPTASS